MLRILIVDDMAVSRLILKKMLLKEGYEVAGEAEDIADAVNKYKSLHPDLVIMDIGLPGKIEAVKKEVLKTGGITAIREIIKIDQNARIIACTAMNYKEIVMEVLSSGAKDYILKPVEPAKLIAAIKKVTGTGS
ncbi:MAG: response regulator [Candidatus Eremiobacterota bacterium]